MMKNFGFRLCVCSVLLWTSASFGWDELSSLDQTVQKFEALEMSEQRAQIAMLTDALDRVSPKKAPEAVKKNLVANFLLGDLESVTGKLKKTDTLSDEDFSEAVGAVHPLLVVLLEELKIPHVCDHPHHNHGKKSKGEVEHDHHDHDHDHHDHHGHDH